LCLKPTTRRRPSGRRKRKTNEITLKVGTFSGIIALSTSWPIAEGQTDGSWWKKTEATGRVKDGFIANTQYVSQMGQIKNQLGGSFEQRACRVHDGHRSQTSELDQLRYCLPDQDSISNSRFAVQQPRPGMGEVIRRGVFNLSTPHTPPDPTPPDEKGGTNQYHGRVVRVFPQQSSSMAKPFFRTTNPVTAEPVWTTVGGGYQGQTLFS